MEKIVVLFEVKPKEGGKEKYLELASELKKLLVGFEGYISGERFLSLNEEGKLLSMNIWESEEAVEKWRNQLTHRLTQKEGREKIFESYKITVCKSIREYSDTERSQAPKDSNDYFKL